MTWLSDRIRWTPSGGWRPALAGGVVTLAAVAALTLAMRPLRNWLELLNIGLVFLLLVVLLTARWGLWVGLFASLCANLALDYFFVPPLHRLISYQENVLSLLVFLAVSGCTSALLARAQAGEATARRHEQETAVLYDLSRMIIVAPEVTPVLEAICQRICFTFSAESAAVLLPARNGPRRIAGSGSASDLTAAYQRRAFEEVLATGEPVFLDDSGRHRSRPGVLADRAAPMAFLPLGAGGRTLGVLQVAGRLRSRIFTEDEVRLLEVFADETALAVDRDRLQRQAGRAAALQEADRLKSALLSAVSHELRTPLGSIKAAVSSLLDQEVEWDPATRRELLTAVDEETDRLTRLVSNLLDLSRIEGGALRPEADWYDVREFLETVTGRLSRVVSRHTLTLNVSPRVGDACFDYVQIAQVVTNLVENAAKFAPEATEIRVSARRTGDEIELAVEDSGPGIPVAERKQVFEKFYQVERGAPHIPGTGLGLAICKGLVEAHGGRIRAETGRAKRGARLVVTLPAPLPPASALTSAVVEAR